MNSVDLNSVDLTPNLSTATGGEIRIAIATKYAASPQRLVNQGGLVRRNGKGNVAGSRDFILNHEMDIRFQKQEEPCLYRSVIVQATRKMESQIRFIDFTNVLVTCILDGKAGS